jgi:Fe-S-cluster formation regulator IscX/YfhJ
MKAKSVHEPEAEVMGAEDVWDDAREIARALHENIQKADPVVQLQIPLSSLLSALEHFSREELEVLQRRVAERLANQS